MRAVEGHAFVYTKEITLPINLIDNLGKPPEGYW